MLLRPPLRLREGGPTPGTGSAVPQRSPDVSDQTHLVQFYDDDAHLVDVVSTFLSEALVKGDGALVIASVQHRTRLEELLEAAGVDVAGAARRGRYVALDAAETLASVLVDDLPDRDRFNRVVVAEVTRLLQRFSRVRAFGEIVGLLTADGNTRAAIEFEAMWNGLLTREPVELLCSYPVTSLIGSGTTAVKRICAAHTEVLAPESYPAPMPPEQRLKALVDLQQKAAALDEEIARRAESESELSDFLENSLEGIYTLAPDGTILWANEAALQMLGHRRKEVVGRHVAEFHADREVIGDILARLATGEGSVTSRTQLLTKSARLKHVVLHAHAIYRDGALVKTRCFMLDETPMAAVERDMALLAAIVDSSDDAIISKDLEGHITSWNRGAQRLFGYEEREVLGKSITILIPPDRLDEEPRILERIRAGERVEHYETVRRRKDGSMVEISLTISPIRDGSGRVAGASKIARDISQRGRSDRLLHLAEERYGRLASMLPVGVFACDQSGAITYFNEHAKKLWGRAPHIGEERLSGSLGMLHPDSGAPLTDDASPIAIALREQRSLRNWELIVEQPGARRVNVLMNVDFIPPENGEGASAVGVFHDVTPMKDTQDQLAQQKQSLETLLEVLPVGVFIAHDPECRLISGNREAERVLRAQQGANLSVSAAEGKGPANFTVVKDGEPVPPELQPVQRAAKGEVVLAEELDLVFSDGSVVHEICWARPIYDEYGQLGGAIACVLDATGLKETERALREADRRKDEFLATLAHELRNPLAPIIAGLDIMDIAADDAELLARTRRTMERQAHQLSTLVDDLLDVSRITTGKFQLRKRTIDLADVVQVAMDASRPAITEGGHRLVVDLPGHPIWLHADPNRLAQVFSNLLDNASKYTPAGGRIEVAATTEAGKAHLSVKDTGIGIPTDKLDLVFEKFIQIDRPQERGHPGLGIGLTLVRAVVELHGGDVSVRSAGPDRGTTFTVTLPILEAPPMDDPVVERKLGTSDRNERTRRVLVVDDNEAMLESLGTVVGLLGHQVRTAHDGHSAIATAEEFRPDIVLMDLGMPRMNGYEAARRIRAQPWGAKIKLVALTGWGQDEHRRRTEDVGFDHHVVKPIRQEDLERLFAES